MYLWSDARPRKWREASVSAHCTSLEDCTRKETFWFVAMRNEELGALLSGTISLAESGPCPGNLLPVDRRDPRRELPKDNQAPPLFGCKPTIPQYKPNPAGHVARGEGTPHLAAKARGGTPPLPPYFRHRVCARARGPFPPGPVSSSGEMGPHPAPHGKGVGCTVCR